MSRVRRQRQSARRGERRLRSAAFRVTEALLWLITIGLFVWRLAPQARAAAGANAGGPAAPAVTLAMLDGRALSLTDFKGQVVLVNFWATWCPPCRAEMPGFQKVYDARHGDGFTVVGVSMDEGSRLGVATFLRNHAISYPVAMATPQTVAAFGGISSFPTFFLIDRRGRVRYTVRGMFVETALRPAVDRLLGERH